MQVVITEQPEVAGIAGQAIVFIARVTVTSDDGTKSNHRVTFELGADRMHLAAFVACGYLDQTLADAIGDAVWDAPRPQAVTVAA